MPGLKVHDLTVFRSGRPVLDGFNAEFPVGTTVLLGPNGAGKSSLMLAICGLLAARSGEVTWGGRSTTNGTDLVDFRRALGWMPQEPRFPPRLRVERFLEAAAWLKGMDEAAGRRAVAASLRRTDLVEFAARRAGQLSGGEGQRLALAAALIADPGVVILDEPTAGLDPQQRGALHALIRDLARDRVVLVSTHLLEDVEGVADRIVVVHHGRNPFSGSVTQFVGVPAGSAVDLPGLRAAWSRVIDTPVNGC